MFALQEKGIDLRNSFRDNDNHIRSHIFNDLVAAPNYKIAYSLGRRFFCRCNVLARFHEYKLTIFHIIFAHVIPFHFNFFMKFIWEDLFLRSP